MESLDWVSGGFDIDAKDLARLAADGNRHRPAADRTVLDGLVRTGFCGDGDGEFGSALRAGNRDVFFEVDNISWK